MTAPSHWRMALCGAAIVVIAALVLIPNRYPLETTTLDDACHTPASIVSSYRDVIPKDASVWYAVVLHGLAANRKVMIPVGQELAGAGAIVYLLDSPGEGDSTYKFSFANNERCAASAVAYLTKSGAIQLDRTVVVGHSLGGAAAIRLARPFPNTAATIALSPAPMIFPSAVPHNLFLLSAQFDPWQLRAGVQDDLAAIRAINAKASDSGLKRWANYVDEPLALHGSVLFDPRVLSLIAKWSIESLGRSSDIPIPARSETLAMSAATIGLVGFALTLPFFATLCVRVTGSFSAAAASPPGPSAAADLPATQLGLGGLYIRLSLAAIAAAVLLIPGVPLRGLHLYSADYVASFLALAGLLLLVLLPRSTRVGLRFDRRAHFAAILFALVALFAFGLWLNWQISSFLPNAARAWRILPLALVSWPYFAAEELALNASISSTSQHAVRDRWLLFLGNRTILLGVLLLAFFGFASGEFLPILISPFMLVISCGQRWGSDLLRARTGSVLAGAAFNAILAAWFFAAVFPLQ